MDNLQEIVALWDKYHYSIATNATEYDRELRQLLFANSNVCDVSDTDIEELISKRQAIDASIEAVNSWNKSCSIGEQKRIENYIKQLPSAEPKIIYCKDCKHFIREDIEEYTPYRFHNNTYFRTFCDKHWDEEQGEYIDVKLDDFCSFAERKEDG